MTTYRIAPGGLFPSQWVVVPTSPDDAPAVQFFENEADAQDVVDRLNAAVEENKA